MIEVKQNEVQSELTHFADYLGRLSPRTGYYDTDNSVKMVIDRVVAALNEAVNDIDWLYDDENLNREPYEK